MRQNYFCPNCGTPVASGARSCMGCGVNFQWIAHSELEQCSPVSYKLPSLEQDTPTHTSNQLTTGEKCEHGQCAEQDTTHPDTQGSVLRAEVQKLLDSIFEKPSRCHKV